MMLTVSMTVSHLNQNLKIVKGVRNRLLKVLIAINAQSHSIGVTPPPPGWGVQRDHLCPYGRKLIGSLVPVHIRCVRSNTYAFLDPCLKLVAFLLNDFNFFPIHYVILLTDVACYGWFMVLITYFKVCVILFYVCFFFRKILQLNIKQWLKLKWLMQNLVKVREFPYGNPRPP